MPWTGVHCAQVLYFKRRCAVSRRTLSETAKNLLHDPPWSSFMEEPLEQLVL